MTRSQVDALRDSLTWRDEAVLRDVDKFRLLTTKQLQRLHFDHTHPTALAAARACHRALDRLRDLGILRTLQRRIGGVRAGSAGFVWYIGPVGERLLQALDSGSASGRRNYREPSRHFVEHSLAVAELAVQVIQLARQDGPGGLEVVELQTEPACWQQSLSNVGTAQWLKPDLRLVTASAEYEHHWFVEVDLVTEHLPVIARQCLAYQAFRATGRYEAGHGLYPIVLWVVPSDQRRKQLQTLIVADKRLDGRLFDVVTFGEFIPRMRAGTADTNTNPNHVVGGKEDNAHES